MTLIISWIGVDSRKISSFYIASDSRFSQNANKKYDYGRKVYALLNSPDILGYCGDVLYPSIVLGQIIDMDRDKILFKDNASSVERMNTVYSILQKKFSEYEKNMIIGPSLEIIHATREGSDKFTCNIYKWCSKNGWTNECIPLPIKSGIVLVSGSGKNEFKNKLYDYQQAQALNKNTSRAIFQCLNNSLSDIQDYYCGGAPQLVGLYNKDNGRNFGTIYQDKNYYLGSELERSEILKNIEWRNELFERCDGQTGKLIKNAQRQPDILRT